MFKAATLLALGLTSSVEAASKCKATINTYSDDTCTTAKEVLPLYVDGEATLNFEFGKCLSQSGSAGDSYMKVLMCDADKFIAIAQFEDGACDNYSTPPVVGFVPGYCTPKDGSTWIEAHDVELTGNKYGIDYFDAWTIIMCQSVLFGVCAGYA